MNIIQPTVLGMIQGLTEFLPISSSGHLILIPSILKWDLQNLAFDVGLHAGTALAVLIYFFKDWKEMVKGLISDLYDSFTSKYKLHTYTLRRETKQFIYILVSTIPVGIIGILFESDIEYYFRSPVSVAIMLILFSIVMFIADSRGKNPRFHFFHEFKFSRIFLVSLSQAIALIPGVSRAGITMSTGIFLGLSREMSARLSFLLATPIILGAAIYKLPDIIGLNPMETTEFIVGFINALVVGYFCVGWLINYLKNKSLKVFIIYRVVLGFFILWLFYL